MTLLEKIKLKDLCFCSGAIATQSYIYCGKDKNII